MTETLNQTKTNDVMLDLLVRAAAAHGEHEKETGEADAQWPVWYTQHMVQAMAAQGYALTRTST
jgi:hypothetical protein